ncbi:hypothetical protein LINPERPRIM_LOCUS24555 [Linum perenne]
MGFEMEEIGDPRTTSELMVSPPTWRVFQRQVQGNGSNFAGRRQWRGKLGERGNISCGFGGRRNATVKADELDHGGCKVDRLEAEVKFPYLNTLILQRFETPLLSLQELVPPTSAKVVIEIFDRDDEPTRSKGRNRTATFQRWDSSA